MQLPHHVHLRAVVRTAVVAVITAGSFTACGGESAPEPPLSAAAETGREIMRTNGCAACHGRNGQGGPGPAFIGLFGSTVELADGTTVVADADYLFESIRDPSAKIVAGYGFPMPGNNLSDAEIESVIAYIEALAGSGGTTG
jgi:mono/diheme cytochrome c family protein